MSEFRCNCKIPEIPGTLLKPSHTLPDKFASFENRIIFLRRTVRRVKLQIINAHNFSVAVDGDGSANAQREVTSSFPGRHASYNSATSILQLYQNSDNNDRARRLQHYYCDDYEATVTPEAYRKDVSSGRELSSNCQMFAHVGNRSIIKPFAYVNGVVT